MKKGLGMVEMTDWSLSPGVRAEERRRLADRRARPTSFLSVFRLRGRRRGFRRAGEGRSQYVDCVSGRVAILALAILVFSVLDALFTLLHLEGGAQEINPFMRVALLAGLPVFLGVKTLGTGAGVVFLAIHQLFRISWAALHGVAIAYAALFTYHMILMYR